LEYPAWWAAPIAPGARRHLLAYSSSSSSPPVDDDDDDDDDDDGEDAVAASDDALALATHAPSAPNVPPRKDSHTLSFSSQSAPSVIVIMVVSCIVPPPSSPSTIESHHPASTEGDNPATTSAHPVPPPRYVPSVLPSHLSDIVSAVHPTPRNSRHVVPSEMPYPCVQLPMIGPDAMAAWAAASSSSVPASSGEEQSPSGTNVPPTNVSHAISLPSQSETGDIVMTVETILTSSTSTTHHPASGPSPGGHSPAEAATTTERTPPSPSHLVRMSSSVHADPWYCSHASPPEKTLA